MPPRDPFAHILGTARQEPLRDPALRLHMPDSEAGETDSPPGDPRKYQAMRLGHRPVRLEILCSSGPSRCPSYVALLDVIYDHRFGGICVLVFHFMTVTLTGRNLSAVVKAINAHAAKAIIEYDSVVHDAPAADAPVIEDVEVKSGKTIEELADQINKAVTVSQK